MYSSLIIISIFSICMIIAIVYMIKKKKYIALILAMVAWLIVVNQLYSQYQDTKIHMLFSATNVIFRLEDDTIYNIDAEELLYKVDSIIVYDDKKYLFKENSNTRIIRLSFYLDNQHIIDIEVFASGSIDSVISMKDLHSEVLFATTSSKVLEFEDEFYDNVVDILADIYKE